ncbi:AsmA family protein [Halomonas alkalicola]|uniref:AsmA family protein n=1 Tax=Halomonas alkalicola TaxID=1930622 RepID=A0ABY9H0N3_9GAMM|nr:AsmA family protein [Halomonas alkalicola]WLI71944.1 AsmA family protein [Halomonas alkalicola]
MRRLLSTLLAAIGILAVLAVAAVVYVTTFFDPEDLKPRLIEVVREQSGLELALEGPLTWSFYPRLGVGVEKAEAWLPEQTVSEETSFVAFRRAEVSLAFTPLLRGEIAIDGMTLDGMRLNLERDEAGRGNWEALMERLAERSEAAEEVLAPAGASAGPVPDGQGGLAVALNIANVQVRDGEVSYRDLGAGHELRLESLGITGSNVNPRSAFPIRTSFRLVGHDDLDPEAQENTPRLTSDVSLEGRVTLGLAERRYRLENLALTTTSRLAAVEGEQKLVLKGSELHLDAIERRLHLAEGSLDATLNHPALGDSPLPLSLAFALEADLLEETAHLRDLVLSGEHGLSLNGNLNVDHLLEAPPHEGQLRLAAFSLRPWLERFDSLPAMADDEALTEVVLTTPVRGDMSRLELAGLTLTLDGSTFTGQLSAGLDGRALDFDLQGDRLDLDAYLPPAEPAGERAAAGLPGITRAHAEAPGALVPAEWLAELALAGELRLGGLGLAGLEFRDVGLTLEGADGRQRLSRFEAGFYEGSLAASGELDLTRDPIHWRLAPRIERVRADELLKALGDEEAALRGRFSADGELTSRGNSWPDLRRHLDGRVEARIDDGAILDVNVSRELCTAVAALEGRETSRDWHPDTRFEEAGATFVIRDGTLNSEDLLVVIPGIELGGEGWLDLISERFELRAAARVVDTADAACRVNPRLERLPFPVRCEGSLSGDSAEWCRFDREAFQSAIGEALRDELGRRVGEEAERRLEGTLERLDERLGEGSGRELRDALRGLLN